MAGNSATSHLNLTSFAKTLWQDANPGSTYKIAISLKEVDLSGTRKVNVATKSPWLSNDESKQDSSAFIADKNAWAALTFEPQRIRTFEIGFKIKKQKMIQLTRQNMLV